MTQNIVRRNPISAAINIVFLRPLGALTGFQCGKYAHLCFSLLLAAAAFVCLFGLSDDFSRPLHTWLPVMLIFASAYRAAKFCETAATSNYYATSVLMCSLAGLVFILALIGPQIMLQPPVQSASVITIR